MTETHTIERTYYHDLGEHGIAPDYESMVAFLLDECVVYMSQMWDAEKKEGAYLCININDYFHPAADSEDLPFSDIPKLFDMYRKDGYNGVAQYVADKRGIENKHWRSKYK
jgi:hypothetical protein